MTRQRAGVSGAPCRDIRLGKYLPALHRIYWPLHPSGALFSAAAVNIIKGERGFNSGPGIFPRHKKPPDGAATKTCPRHRVAISAPLSRSWSWLLVTPELQLTAPWPRLFSPGGPGTRYLTQERVMVTSELLSSCTWSVSAQLPRLAQEMMTQRSGPVIG